MLARADALAALAAEPFDVLVIGGGITGAGVALDAASRGYAVALVEMGDYARGTSSRSSKLVHGGLRYLQNFDLGLVREALLERQLMAALAPHLVRPLPMLVPAFDGARPDRLVGHRAEHLRRHGRRPAGAAGGATPARSGAPRATGSSTAPRSPSWRPRSPAATPPAATCSTTARPTTCGSCSPCSPRRSASAPSRPTAPRSWRSTGERRAGARGRRAARRARHPRGQRHGRVGRPAAARGAPRRGRGARHPAQPRHARPPARGAAAGRRRGDRARRRRARRSSCCRGSAPRSSGTTDNDYDGDIERVRPSEADVDHLLDAVNAFFGTALGRPDVAGAYAGVRPLIASGDPRKSVDISRKAELYETSSGLITITGGKLTTWRRMAKLAVDRIVEREGRDAPCRTHEIPLGMAVEPDALPRAGGVAEDAYPQLAGALRARRARRPRPRGRPAGAGGARAPRPPRPARRGCARRAARAGGDGGRRPAAAHAARPARGARRCARTAATRPSGSRRRWGEELGWDGARVAAEAHGLPRRGGRRGARGVSAPARTLRAAAARSRSAARRC